MARALASFALASVLLFTGFPNTGDANHVANAFTEPTSKPSYTRRANNQRTARNGNSVAFIEAQAPVADEEIPAPVLCSNPVGQLISDTVKSEILGQELPVQIYLPPCYNGMRYEYPALYLIQGSGYETGEWVDDGIVRIANLQMALAILPPFIIVMPANDLNNGDASCYIDSTGGQGSWEDFIVNELVPRIDQKYSTWKEREGRAIGGISRGGYWSLEIAFTNPDKFSAVGGHSPAIASTYLDGVSDNFSMLSFAKSTDELKQLRISIDAGNNDETLTGMLQLADELDAQKLPYISSIGDGIHNDAYWSSRIDDYMAFYAADWPIQPRNLSRQLGSNSYSTKASQ